MTPSTARTAIHSVHPLARIAAAALVVLASPALHAQQLLAPDAPVASFSQSYLSAKWSNWAILYPPATSPVVDTTGAYSSVGDQGSYFFLAGSLGGDPVTRTVTVRTDQTLFFPLLSTLSVVPYFGLTEAEIRADASDNVGTLIGASVTFDGAPAWPATGTSSLADHRQQSPLFPASFGADNIFGVPQGVLDAVSDGWWVAMAPLTPGIHTLHFTAMAEGQGAYTGFTYIQDITYQISAVPEAGTAAMLGVGLALLLALGGGADKAFKRPFACRWGG